MGSAKHEGRTRVAVSKWAIANVSWCAWYAELPPGQGQLRELYMVAVDAADPGLREKCAKIYRNY